MKKIIRHGLLTCFLWIAALTSLPVRAAADSVSTSQDSLIKDLASQLQNLNSQLQDMNLQNLMLQEELERTGRKVMMDSISLAHRIHLIDSLRAITPGAPLVVDGDTLLRLYARRGAISPEQRVETVRETIERLGHRLSLGIDTIYVFKGDLSSDIMSGNEIILSITDNDGLWAGTSREKLAADHAILIQAKINELQDEYGLHRKLWGLILALVIIAVQVLLLILTNRIFRRWKKPVMLRVVRKLKPVIIKDYEFLDIHRQGILIMSLYKGLRYYVIFLQLCISIPLLFSIFPETETLTYTLLGYVWNPFKDILMSVFSYIPKLFQIIVIWLCFHYLMRLLRYFTREIESEHLKIDGFYADWAQPTYLILRVLLYSLMLVMIWPLLPSSNSEIFQGVSVFIGLILSLGSTSIVGNVIAGLVMTYMRPFRLGDYIQVGDTVGEVIEKTVLVTRIRTRKNEIVTIQNSSLMGSQTSNFSLAARNYGIIVHTKVTIGYDVPWQKIKDIMESAAMATPGIKHKPRPFMQITALNDFYVEYEINAFTADAAHLPTVYSELHANLQEVGDEAADGSHGQQS